MLYPVDILYNLHEGKSLLFCVGYSSIKTVVLKIGYLYEMKCMLDVHIYNYTQNLHETYKYLTQ